MRTRLLLICGAVGFGGCGGAGPSLADASMVDARAPDAATCTKLWTVRKNGGASATITGGMLVLASSDTAQGSAIEVTQSGLTGDFTVEFSVTSFTAGGTGGFVQAGISADVASPTQFITSAIGTFPTVGISATNPAGQSDIKGSTETSGTLRFIRVGDTVSAVTVVNSATASESAVMTGALRVGVQLGSNMGTVVPAMGATIDQFTNTGSGISADTFDCDSLEP